MPKDKKAKRNDDEQSVSRSKERGRSTQKRGGGTTDQRDETELDMDLSDTETEVSVDQSIKNSKQQTIPAMVNKQTELQNDTRLDDIMEKLETMSVALSQMATKAYIDENLKKLVTSETLNKALTGLKGSIRKEIEEGVGKEVHDLKTEISQVKGELMSREIEAQQLKRNLESARERQKKDREAIDSLLAQQAVMKEELNSVAQYTRKNTVRIYGLHDTKERETAAETSEKVIELLRNNLKMKVERSEISIAHRLGIFSPDADRPVICKLISRTTKNEIIANRRKLKNTQIVIKEDLTRQNQARLKDISEAEDVERAWYHDGKFWAKLTNERIVRINHDTDITELMNESYRHPPQIRPNLNPGAFLRGRGYGYRRARGQYNRGRGRGRGEVAQANLENVDGNEEGEVTELENEQENVD